MIQISKILCPVDFSEFSRDALDHAVALAHWYRAELLVLHVFVIPSVPVPAAGFLVESLTPMSISPGGIAGVIVERRNAALPTAIDEAIRAAALAVRSRLQRRRLKPLHHRKRTPLLQVTQQPGIRVLRGSP